MRNPILLSEEDKSLQLPHRPAKQTCHSQAGYQYEDGDVWKSTPCQSCTCRSGQVHCFSQVCPTLPCSKSVLRKGSCCPTCLGKAASQLSFLKENNIPVVSCQMSRETTLVFQTSANTRLVQMMVLHMLQVSSGWGTTVPSVTALMARPCVWINLVLTSAVNLWEMCRGGAAQCVWVRLVKGRTITSEIKLLLDHHQMFRLFLTTLMGFKFLNWKIWYKFVWRFA